jgi:hypothetical protein
MRKNSLLRRRDDLHPEHIPVEPHGVCHTGHLKCHGRNLFNIHRTSPPTAPALKTSPHHHPTPRQKQVTGSNDPRQIPAAIHMEFHTASADLLRSLGGAAKDCDKQARRPLGVHISKRLP